ncbi:hypothetical protein N0V87_003394 [Didymella glomerata]|uniref:Uncharacterized protein n=1 Tax=Didymella glomerata TaxID=749621 RepID=A0A9W8X3D1_9PLEO|nr:hypothetical protein N0V87_003394 [Didymella glomerata]
MLSMASTIPERKLLSNAGNAARANRNFDVVDEDVYRWYGQYPTDYDGEEQESGRYHGQDGADERGVMDDFTSHRSGSVPSYICGGASEPEDVEDDTVYQSADYDPVGVSRAIAKLNKTLARAQKRAASGPANDDIVTNLMQRIAWLKSQRDYAEGSDGSSPSTAGMRGGAGQTDDADYNSVEEDIDPEQQDVDNEDGWIRNYNHRAVTQAILNLHGELGAALNLVAKLETEIVRLKMQRDIQDGSDIIQQILERNRDVYSASFGMMRGGAGDDDYDEEFRVRHPECSSDTAATVGPELLELDKEIRRLNLLMARAQKLPEGDKSNWDILAQLQRMIDQLEAERDAARKLSVYSNTHERQDEKNLRGGTGEEQDVHACERDLKYDLDACPTPPLPPKNPAREDKRPPVIAYLRGDPLVPSKERPELDEVIDLITFLDKSRAWIEPLILEHIASPDFDRRNVSLETMALIIKLDRLLEIRQGLWRRAKVLAWSDESAMETVRGHATTATTSVNAFRSYAVRPHTTEARLRGGGSVQSTIQEEGGDQRAVPGSFSSNAAPPVPARNPARVRGVSTTPSYDSDLDREIVALERDVLRASQQFLARVSQITPSSYLAGLEAGNIERLVARIQELKRRRARTAPSQFSPSTRRDSGTGVDAETQAGRSAIQRTLTAILHAAGTWAATIDNVDPSASETRSPEPQASSLPAPAHPPYRVLNCQDWTWAHPNRQFDNLSPSQKISLLRERDSWLARQRNIQEERHAIDIEIARLRSLTALEHDPATHCTLITPGFDGLGNWEGGWLARQYNRTPGSS